MIQNATPTMHFRWLQRPIEGSGIFPDFSTGTLKLKPVQEKVLQQKFIDPASPHKYEWRDVPVVEEEEDVL